MNILKSHFWYNKRQRNGIFFLALLILLLQGTVIFGHFSSDEVIDENNPELIAVRNQIDSLHALEIEKRKPKTYPFNPNYITDYKGEQLGMSLEEIDRLLAFRKTTKFINSKKEFQQVTKISDSLLNQIAPFFRFPDWVVKRNQESSKEKSNSSFLRKQQSKIKKIKLSTTDINKATATDLQSINGIGGKLSERIIKYRTRLQGFSFENQLYEVWNLDKQIADKILTVFKIIEKPVIVKKNINTINFKELLQNPYIEYDLCKNIFDYRDEIAELQSISELKNIKDFPIDKYSRIVLYLLAE